MIFSALKFFLILCTVTVIPKLYSSGQGTTLRRDARAQRFVDVLASDKGTGSPITSKRLIALKTASLAVSYLIIPLPLEPQGCPWSYGDTPNHLQDCPKRMSPRLSCFTEEQSSDAATVQKIH